MARSSRKDPLGRHAKHIAQEDLTEQRVPEQEFPYNPYNTTIDMPSDGPVPFSNKADELARLRKKKRSQKRRAPKIIAAVVIVLVLVIGASGVALAMSANDAKKDAQTLVIQAKQVKDQVMSGNMSAAKETSEDMAQTASQLRDTTSGPLWSVATIIPFVGSDIRTVQIVANTADVLASDVLIPALDAFPSNGLAGIIGEGGAINVKVLSDLLGVVADSGPVLSEYAAELDATPEPNIDQLKEPISQVKTLMSTLAPIADSASELEQTLPAMLGANGKRTYLVIACSAAEMRSSVGFAGSFAVMTVDNGKISFGDFAGYNDNRRLENSVPAATEEDKRLFRWESSVDSRDVTQIIDFERVGEIESQIWEANGHGKVDGVIGIDTVVLQRMLGLTGTKVTTPGGDVLDGNTTSDFLLNGVYIKYPEGEVQDAIFALVADAAAKGIFGNIGKVNIADFAKVLTTSVEQGRIAIYMANDKEEAMLEEFGLAGTVSSDLTVPETGIYTSACQGGKMYFYLASDIDVGAPTKNADGSYTYDMKVTFTNTLTKPVLETLTPYIMNGVGESGGFHFLIYLLAPTGGKISDVKTEGTFYGGDKYPFAAFGVKGAGNDPMNETTYQGNDLWYGWTHLGMGGKTVVTYKVTTSTQAEGELVVRTTPLSDDTVIDYQQ